MALRRPYPEWTGQRPTESKNAATERTDVKGDSGDKRESCAVERSTGLLDRRYEMGDGERRCRRGCGKWRWLEGGAEGRATQERRAPSGYRAVTEAKGKIRAKGSDRWQERRDGVCTACPAHICAASSCLRPSAAGDGRPDDGVFLASGAGQKRRAASKETARTDGVSKRQKNFGWNAPKQKWRRLLVEPADGRWTEDSPERGRRQLR
jgi:hypothetical protein